MDVETPAVPVGQRGEAMLFKPIRLGDLNLANRMVMAPMTRRRALEGRVSSPLAETYYVQRASAGLIVSEGTLVSPQAVGHLRTPGIYAHEQVMAWRGITAAVHRAGGAIFLQLWHVGRVSHPDFQGGRLPVAPSAISPGGNALTETGVKPRGVPRALALAEISDIVARFRTAAENAKSAGFDGVEIHGANGYLLDQFTRDGANRRTDAYGGSIENRARLPLEVTRAVIEVWGAQRVGYRISPRSEFNAMSDSNPLATFTHLAEELSKLDIAYLHVVDPAAPEQERVSAVLRKKFRNAYIVNGGFDFASANAALGRGEADLVAFGVAFLANPDLPLRYRLGAALNVPDQTTFYDGGAEGYTDYPALTG